LLDNAELAAFLAGRDEGNRIRVFPSGRAELEGLSPEKIVQQYPVLAEFLEALLAQGQNAYRHAQGTAYYASLTGRELGLSQKAIQGLALAGWLHDIGKLPVPEMQGRLPKKLSKLPDLSDKVHPAVGAYILKNIIALPTVLKGIRYHHADYDGQGEPSGLAGKAIPLAARIIAAADAYQNLREKKKGDPSFSRNDLFGQLRRMAGRRLDPEVVESLIRATTGQ
jgi:HD-GYP domain-containing protein (c-di-GMP phosphodiesterase class II)